MNLLTPSLRSRAAQWVLLLLPALPALSQELSPIHHFSGLTAGSHGEAGFRDGPFWSARFNGPSGLAVSPNGRLLLVADKNNHRIRCVDLWQRNRVSTLSGTGEVGQKDGPKAEATWNKPSLIAFLSPDKVVVLDSGNRCLRTLNLASGTVSTLTGPGKDPKGTDLPFKDLMLESVTAMVFLPEENSLFLSVPGSLWYLDLDRSLGSSFSYPSQAPQPSGLAAQGGRLCLMDESTGKLFWRNAKKGEAGTLEEAGTFTASRNLAATGAALYSLGSGKTLLTRLLPKPRPLRRVSPYGFGKALGGDPLDQGFELVRPCALAASPTEERRFFICDEDRNVIYTCVDYDFAMPLREPGLTPWKTRDYDYPAAKPHKTFRILLVGTSYLYFMSGDEDSYWLSVTKQLENDLSLRAALDGSDTNYEVMGISCHSGEEFPPLLWPYYRVPEIVKRYDIDLVLYVAVPQSHPSYEAYYKRPIGPEGLPTNDLDPEFNLTPFAERSLDPLAERFLEKLKKAGMIQVPVQEPLNFPEFQTVLEKPSLREDLVALMGRPMGLLNKKLQGMTSSSGKPVGLRILFTPLTRRDIPSFQDFWTQLARTQAIPFSDLTAPIAGLRPAYDPLTEGGHGHFYTQAHYFLSEIFFHELVQEGLIPWKGTRTPSSKAKSRP